MPNMGEIHFHSQEFLRSGSKAEDVKEILYGLGLTERCPQKDRKLVITMACYALQTPPRVAQEKQPGPKEIWQKTVKRVLD